MNSKNEVKKAKSAKYTGCIFMNKKSSEMLNQICFLI